jgi:uncharacterized membrane protein YiaA
MATQPVPAAGKPTPAFIGASWAVLILGRVSYGAGLWNATMERNEKGLYAAGLVLGLFAAVAVQKNVRHQLHFRAPSHAATSTHPTGRLTGVIPGALN